MDDAEVSGARVSAWDEIQEFLTEQKLGWITQTPPDVVGIHESNRSKLGVGGSEAHYHGFDILKIGFSWRKSSDATAFECPPAPHDAEAKRVNESWVQLSGGLIPPLTQMRLLSVGGGHTNSFLRAVQAGCKSAVPDIADASGNLNAEELGVNRPAFREAVQKGLKWYVVHWQCAFAWPKLPSFIQSALNTEARGMQSEVEIMLHMHEQMQDSLAHGKDPDWKAIQAAAGNSLPPCAPYISTLALYVQTNAGGVSGELLTELSLHQKTFACNKGGPGRAMGSEFMHKLANLNFGNAERLPYMQNAAINANMLAPPHKIADGYCRLLTPSQVASLTSKENKAKCREAENVMASARDLCKNIPSLSKMKYTQLIGQLDVRMILHILKKGKEGPENKDFKTLANIAEAFVTDLSAELGYAINSPWAAGSSTPAKEGNDAEASAKELPDTVEQLKSKMHQAKKLGFVVDAVVTPKAELQLWRITDISDVHIVCSQVVAGKVQGEPKTIVWDQVFASWRLHKGRVTAMLPGWSLENKCSPLDSQVWQFEAAKSAVTLALMSEYKDHQHIVDKLELLQNPTSVLTTDEFKIGGLQLVPASQRIERKQGDKGLPVGKFSIGGDLTKLYITPQFVPPMNAQGEANKAAWVAPFWLVTQTDDNDANMKLTFAKRVVHDYVVYVPILKNNKRLAIGDELKWNNQAATTEPWKSLAEVASPTAKKKGKTSA